MTAHKQRRCAGRGALKGASRWAGENDYSPAARSLPCLAKRGVLTREEGTASRPEHRGGVEPVLTAGACRR
jgi:hypothetical protein